MSRPRLARLLTVTLVAALLHPIRVLANAGETLSLLTSAREAALGGPAALDGAATGLTANPAAATGTRPMVSATYAQWLGDARVAQCSAAASSSLGRAGIMVGVLDAGAMTGVDSTGAVRTIRAQQDLAASATFRRNVVDGFAVGVAVTYLRTTLVESTHAQYALADFGGRWTSADDRLAFGAAMRHLGMPLGTTPDALLHIPVAMDMGGAWKAIQGSFGSLTGTVDYRTPSGARSQGIVGAELGLREVLWLRTAAVATGPDRTVSLGLGFRLRKVQFDYALVKLAGMTATSRSSLTFLF